jgi:archaeosortase B (VPXXXP-CTERM-specific)
MAGHIQHILGNPKTRAAGRVLIVLLGLALALVAYYRLFGTPLVDAVSVWTASSTASVLGLLGTSVSTEGTIVGSADFAYRIVAECTAIGPILLFVGAVIAYPATVRNKILGVGLGIVSLSLINLIRLVSLFYIGAAFPRYLPMAHLLIWQAAIIISAILIWLFWVDRASRPAHG